MAARALGSAMLLLPCDHGESISSARLCLLLPAFTAHRLGPLLFRFGCRNASCFLEKKRGFCGQRGTGDFPLCAFPFEVHTLVAAVFRDVLVTRVPIGFNLIFIRELQHVVLASPQEGLETPCRRENTSYLHVNSSSPQM